VVLRTLYGAFSPISATVAAQASTLQILWSGLWRFSDSHWLPPCFFSTCRVFFHPKRLSFSRRQYACLRGSFRVVKVLHPKHFLSISWISISPVDALSVLKVAPPCQSFAQLDAAEIRMSPPQTTPGFLPRPITC